MSANVRTRNAIPRQAPWVDSNVATSATAERMRPKWREAVWIAFVVVALLALDLVEPWLYGVVVPAAAMAIAVVETAIDRRPGLLRRTIDRADLVAVAALSIAVVGLFRLAFGVFTTENTLGLFLSFGGALVLGVAGPVAYTVWIRRRPLRALGFGLHNLRTTVVLALLFGSVQFAITLWGYGLPRPRDWVPLLVMALTVGVFESIFFRGFVQERLENSLGVGPAILGASILYALYHVGYGMRADEMLFLFGLGVVYAISYRLTQNVLVLWPLLTPLGSFFAQLEAGDLAGELPWASIAGFADVLGLMALALWLAFRRERRFSTRPNVLKNRWSTWT